jgi:hypothetical protein
VRSASPAAVGNPYGQFDVFDALDLAAGIAGRQSRNLAKVAEAVLAELQAKSIVAMEQEV